VAAILHLGNVEFAEGDDVDSSKPKNEKSMFHLKTAAELFMYVLCGFFLEIVEFVCISLFCLAGAMRKH
jgi:hypothetical protein